MTGISPWKRFEALRSVRQDVKPVDLSRVAVVIPALNEARNLSILLPSLHSIGVGQIVVGDNGSSDDTGSVVSANGAIRALELKRGYGAACHAAIMHLANTVEVVAFVDADLSVDVGCIPGLVEPILRDECDFVLGVRIPQGRQPGSMTWPQRLANRLFPLMIRMGWGFRYRDMGPFRAIRRRSLQAMDMQDRAFGWTIEMQIKAVEHGLRIREIPVDYHKRKHGASKISSTLRGVVLAAYWITRTCAALWWTRRRRMR